MAVKSYCLIITSLNKASGAHVAMLVNEHPSIDVFGEKISVTSDQNMWLLWSSAFLIPWALVYLAFPVHRQAML